MTFTSTLATSVPAADNEEYTAVLGPQGRIVIPIEIRKKLGLEPGTVINIWMEDGEVHLRSRAAARASARKLFKDARARLGGGSLVDELLAERRAEAARELADEN